MKHIENSASYLMCIFVSMSGMFNYVCLVALLNFIAFCVQVYEQEEKGVKPARLLGDIFT